jgi:hypothetical protein
MRNLSAVLAVVFASLCLVLAVSSVAFAGFDVPVPVPEISPTSISAGLAILAGGVLMVRARRRK